MTDYPQPQTIKPIFRTEFQNFAKDYAHFAHAVRDALKDAPEFSDLKLETLYLAFQIKQLNNSLPDLSRFG